MVIRWDSEKQQYTAQRLLLPATQRITISRTFGSNLQRKGDETNVFNSGVRVASDIDAFSGQVVERSERSAHTGKLGKTVNQSSACRARKLTGIIQALFYNSRFSPLGYIWVGGE